MKAVIAILALLVATPAAAQQTAHATIPVTLGTGITGVQSGRIIVFTHKVAEGAPAPAEVDTSAFEPTGTAIAARETWSLAPGDVASIDGDSDSFPTAFSKLPAGTYAFQAVLDRNHDYNYGGRGAGDIVSPVVEAAMPGPIPTLTLDSVVPAETVEARLARLPAARRAAVEAALPNVKAVDFISPALSQFWGRPMHIRGWVALPPGNGAGGKSFPTVYSTWGFG
jgi:uncharacterized protein (DUF2141 family)